MGCGELVVKLKLKLRDELQPGAVIKLTATDAGAPEDIPAWCRLTNNPLLSSEPRSKTYVRNRKILRLDHERKKRHRQSNRGFRCGKRCSGLRSGHHGVPLHRGCALGRTGLCR
ncbi:MAG: sulfurtransferase TusA family protein [Yaniella sp.]|nr:sulfurtransferase TusA family protein [Yaniella sp.]